MRGVVRVAVRPVIADERAGIRARAVAEAAAAGWTTSSGSGRKRSMLSIRKSVPPASMPPGSARGVPCALE
jgi:hypothetical protein